MMDRKNTEIIQPPTHIESKKFEKGHFCVRISCLLFAGLILSGCTSVDPKVLKSSMQGAALMDIIKNKFGSIDEKNLDKTLTHGSSNCFLPPFKSQNEANNHSFVSLNPTFSEGHFQLGIYSFCGNSENIWNSSRIYKIDYEANGIVDSESIFSWKRGFNIEENDLEAQQNYLNWLKKLRRYDARQCMTRSEIEAQMKQYLEDLKAQKN